jgi:hypothetical protein
MKITVSLISLTIFCLILGGLCLAQEEKIKENWDKFKEVWNEVYEYMSEQEDDQPAVPFPFGPMRYKPIKDEELKLYAKVGKLLEKADLLKDEEDLDDVAFGIKKFFKLGISKSGGGMGIIRIIAPGQDRENPSQAFSDLKEALEELKDGDKDALKDIKKSLKILDERFEEMDHFKLQRVLRLTEALVLGQDFPEKPKPSAELTRRIGELIKRLAHEDFRERDKAEDELRNIGELAESALRKALEETKDAEVKTRIERLLGEEEKEEDEEDEE